MVMVISHGNGGVLMVVVTFCRGSGDGLIVILTSGSNGDVLVIKAKF